MVFLASTGTAVLWVALGTCVACIVHLFPDSTLGFLARKFQAKNILLGACRGQRKLRWEVWGGVGVGQEGEVPQDQQPRTLLGPVCLLIVLILDRVAMLAFSNSPGR